MNKIGLPLVEVDIIVGQLVVSGTDERLDAPSRDCHSNQERYLAQLEMALRDLWSLRMCVLWGQRKNFSKVS